jgi:hypothetical protein
MLRSRRSKKPWVAAAPDGGNPSARRRLNEASALSSLGIIDLLAFLAASIALVTGQRSTLLADTAQAHKGDLAAGEIAQAETTDGSPR